MSIYHKKVNNRLGFVLDEYKKIFNINYSINSTFNDFSIELENKTTGNKYKVDRAGNLDLNSFLQGILIEERNHKLNKLLN